MGRILILGCLVAFLASSCTKEIEKVLRTTDTLYLPALPILYHDTITRTSIKVDTIVKWDTHTDTVIEKIHDTLIITKTRTDTLFKYFTDTAYLTKITHDTLIKTVTVVNRDTIVQYVTVTKHDTISKTQYLHDTVNNYYTTYIHDTIIKINTVVKVDTVYRSNLNLPEYIGDSVLIFVYPGTLKIIKIKVYNLTDLSQHWEGIPNASGTITVPNYPLASLGAEITNITSGFIMRLETYQDGSASEVRVRYEGQKPDEVEDIGLNFLQLQTASNLYFR